MTEHTDEQINRWKSIEEVALRAQEFYNKVCVFGEESFAKVLADDFNKALKPIEPKLYAGLTEDEWQRVVDEQFDVKHPRASSYSKLVDLTYLQTFTEDTIELRQELGHRQPYFHRLGLPSSVNDFARVFIKIRGEWLTPINNNYAWSNVSEFIQLTKGK